MPRKTTWKEVHLNKGSEVRQLKATLEGGKRDFGRYQTSFDNEGVAIIETNMPWSLMRTWFSFAGVPLPKEVLTDDKPSWEAYPDGD